MTDNRPLMATMQIGKRVIADAAPPLVIAEIGINHEGDFSKARRMVDDAARAGCECVKFQCHVIDDEMIPAAGEVIPGNATESILTIMQRCALSDEQDRELKAYTESLGMIYLSTPFSRAAADRLEKMNVGAYKIGSGECNNYPLVKHIAGFGKPVILSTGMNDIASVAPSVEILRSARVPFALLHCTSMYPTPYDKVRLGGIADLKAAFADAVVGLSDHTLGNYTCLAAVALGARILERHFTSDKSWPGPDVPISMDPAELKDLVDGSRAVFEALGGGKTILGEEQPTIDFAYACVVTTKPIQKGDRFSGDNTWVKRPGTGEIKAKDYERVLGRTAARALPAHAQVSWADVA
jgi:sialic acid synthase SpsE